MTRIVRPIRAGVFSLLALAAVLVLPGSALAAHTIGTTGHPGIYGLTDRAAEPGAKCSYVGGGTAGSIYLTGIKMRHDLTVYGIHTGLRSVSYRPIVQEYVGGVWKNVHNGTLVSGQARKGHPATLPRENTSVPALTNPTKFRLVLKITWYRLDASVEATRTVALDAYVKYNDLAGTSCKGRVVTA